MKTKTMYLLLLIMPSLAIASENTQLTPGQYITKGGWGYLSIKSENEGKLAFKLFSIVTNGHTCDLAGEILNGRTILKDDFQAKQNDKPCVVNLLPSSEGVSVTIDPNSGSCSSFCGLRGYFEGVYLKVPKSCAPEERKKSQAEFKRLYDRKEYQEARNKLEPLLKGCSDSLEWIEKGWVHNDLAVTQYKLGDLRGCQQSLKPYAADAARSEEDIRKEYPPRDADSYIAILKATRTNLKLCKSKTR